MAEIRGEKTTITRQLKQQAEALALAQAAAAQARTGFNTKEDERWAPPLAAMGPACAAKFLLCIDSVLF